MEIAGDDLGDLDRFLKSGAFLRLSQDKIRIFWGPWRPAQPEQFDIAQMSFFNSEPEFLSAERVIEVSRGDLLRFFEPVLQGARFWFQGNFQQPSPMDFEKSFQIIQGKIQRGEIEKAVPIVFSHCPQRPTESDLAQSVLNLLQGPGEMHAYGFWTEGRGVLGLTPEILFHRQGLIVQTMALAGSCPKEDVNSRIALMKDPKELREHELVVNDLVSRLKPLGWLKKNELEVLELPTLLHLRTKLEVVGCAKRDVELLKLLHPTPAVGVAPRAYGHSWMRELPNQAGRDFFGGPCLFKVAEDESLALVMIRSIFWDEAGSHVGAGCGLVAASDLEREWRELEVKRQSIFKAFGI